MDICLAKIDDLPTVMRVISECKKNMRKNGVEQWVRGYPLLIFIVEGEEVASKIMALARNSDDKERALIVMT